MSSIIIDELIVTFSVPENLPEVDVQAIRRKLASNEFIRQMRQFIDAVVGLLPELKLDQLSITY